MGWFLALVVLVAVVVIVARNAHRQGVHDHELIAETRAELEDEEP